MTFLTSTSHFEVHLYNYTEVIMTKLAMHVTIIIIALQCLPLIIMPTVHLRKNIYTTTFNSVLYQQFKSSSEFMSIQYNYNNKLLNVDFYDSQCCHFTVNYCLVHIIHSLQRQVGIQPVHGLPSTEANCGSALTPKYCGYHCDFTKNKLF